MYSQSNSRIITKYADFLREQETNPNFEPPLLTTSTTSEITRKVIDIDSPYTSPHPVFRHRRQEEGRNNDSDSGWESPSTNTNSTMTVISAEVHRVDDSGHPESLEQKKTVPYSFGKFTTSKFSDLFTPDESHALLQRNLLIESEEGSFLRERRDSIIREKNKVKVKGDTDLILSPSSRVRQNDLNYHRNNEKELVIEESESDQGHHHLPHDIDPLPAQYANSLLGLSSLADINAVTLRRELLNNIRAMSHATFFENLYTGHSKSGNELEPENSSDTNNNPSTNVANDELEEFLRVEAEAEMLVVSEKGELLIFESQSQKSGNGLNGPKNLVEPDLDKTSSIHQWILNSQNESEVEEGLDRITSAETLPGVEHSQPSVDLDLSPLHQEKEEVTKADKSLLPYSKSLDKPDDIESIDEKLHVLPISNHSSPLPIHFVQPELTETEEEVSIDSKGVPQVDRFTPMFSRVVLENEDKEFDKFQNYNPHLPKLLNRSLSYMSSNVSFHENHSKQVRYPSVLPKRSLTKDAVMGRESQNRRFKGNLPGVLLRQNMDQWVAKIVRFYVNGDKHLSRLEYRFRPGRDVHSFDGLCDILSERLKLSHGVRYVFTLDGQPISSVDDLKHENAYVVSTTKKFKALNYGGEVVGTENKEEEQHSKRRGRNRPPSAPSQRNPPIIRVRRERSLNGVVWGSPQQDLSGSERNINRNNLQRSAVEAEKVFKAAIEESQAGTHAQTVHKQIIRLINGSDPTIQSQVLLNTRVPQEWVDLVKDLGLAVKIPRTVESRMETLTGRPIQSYSQLRSQFKAGNEAFYIYNMSLNRSNSTINTSRKKTIGANGSSPFGSTSSPRGKSVSNPTLPILESFLGQKFPNSIVHLTSQRSNHLKVPRHNIKSISSSSLYAQVSKSEAQPTNQNTLLSNASSQPNLRLTQRRKSTRERDEASKYLATHHRSRVPSP